MSERGGDSAQSGRRRWIWGAIASTIALIASLITIADRNPFPWAIDSSHTATNIPEESTYGGDWGPERATFTIDSPASYAVMNSIIDNPAYGDERNFVQIKQAASSSATYTDDITVSIGDELTVYAVFDNNTADNLASPAATIQNLAASIVIGRTSDFHTLAVVFESVNAPTVWDGVRIRSYVPIRLEFVSGSGKLFTGVLDGAPIEDALGDGTPVFIGTYGTDGKLLTGFDENGVYLGSGYLTFNVRVFKEDS